MSERDPLIEEVQRLRLRVSQLETEQEGRISDDAAIFQYQRVALDSSVIGVIFLRDEQIHWCNQRFLRLFEFSQEDLPILSVGSLFFDPQQSIETLEFFSRTDLCEDARFIDCLMVGKSGIPFWCRISGSFVDAQVPQIGAIWQLENIDQKRKAEFSLRESESRFRNLAESAPFGILSCDTDGNITFVNEETIRILGSPSPEHTIAINLLTFPPLKETGLSLHLRKCMATKSKIVHEFNYTTKWRKFVMVRAVLAPILNAQNIVSGVLITIEEITERKRAEKELLRYKYQLEEMVEERTQKIIDTNQRLTTEINERAVIEKQLRISERRFYQLVEQAGDGIMVLNFSGTILEVNRRGSEMLQYNRRELLRVNLFDIDQRMTREEFQSLPAQLEIESPLTRETVYRRKDDSLFHIEASLGLIRYPEGRRILAIFRDVSRRRSYEKERERLIAKLEAQNTELERYTYTVSHDLKSPLITIRGFLDHIQRDQQNQRWDRLPRFLDHIDRATNSMLELLQEMLDLAKVGRVAQNPESCLLREIVDSALQLVGGRLQERGVAVEVQEPMPSIFGDRRRLVEILQNLLDNAVKYMGDQKEPKISVYAYQDESTTTCCVQDNGMGIQKEYQGKVFQLFEKINSDSEGTGIGLALVNRIVEVHNGKIWVESQGVGQGSLFCFRLPNK